MAGSIGIALGSAGPTVSIVPTLAAVVAASSFASPIAILICGCPCWPSLGRFVGSTALGGRQASTASVVRYFPPNGHAAAGQPLELRRLTVSLRAEIAGEGSCVAFR